MYTLMYSSVNTIPFCTKKKKNQTFATHFLHLYSVHYASGPNAAAWTAIDMLFATVKTPVCSLDFNWNNWSNKKKKQKKNCQCEIFPKYI